MLQLGLGIGPGNVIFSVPFFFCVKVTNTFVLHVNGSCDIHGVRTTKVCDVTMMYCKEWYIEKVPFSPKSLCSTVLSKQNMYAL